MEERTDYIAKVYIHNKEDLLLKIPRTMFASWVAYVPLQVNTTDKVRFPAQLWTCSASKSLQSKTSSTLTRTFIVEVIQCAVAAYLRNMRNGDQKLFLIIVSFCSAFYRASLGSVTEWSNVYTASPSLVAGISSRE